MGDRRTATHGDQILSEIADLLIDVKGLLGEVRDRLPEQQPSTGEQDAEVEVRGVDAPAAPRAKKAAAKPRASKKQ